MRFILIQKDAVNARANIKGKRHHIMGAVVLKLSPDPAERGKHTTRLPLVLAEKISPRMVKPCAENATNLPKLMVTIKETPSPCLSIQDDRPQGGAISDDGSDMTAADDGGG